jgi:hypothetical protein
LPIFLPGRTEVLAKVLQESPDRKLQEIAAGFPARGKLPGTLTAKVVLGNNPLRDLANMDFRVLFPATFAKHVSTL